MVSKVCSADPKGHVNFPGDPWIDFVMDTLKFTYF
jgi:hypothetical protein